MPLKSLLICDGNGYPFFTRDFNSFKTLDSSLFSGLISAIGSIGKKLFNENIADISFGTSNNPSKIAVIQKELFSQDRNIFFVYLYDGNLQIKNMKELSTNIFIESKQLFQRQTPDVRSFKDKIDNILEHQYNDLKGW